MPPCFALSSVSYPPTRFRTDFAPPTSCLPDPFSHVSIRRTDCTSLMDSEKETREAPESASSSAERLWCSSDGAGTPRRSERRQRGEDWRREIGGFWRRDAQRECPRRGQWWRKLHPPTNTLRMRTRPRSSRWVALPSGSGAHARQADFAPTRPFPVRQRPAQRTPRRPGTGLVGDGRGPVTGWRLRTGPHHWPMSGVTACPRAAGLSPVAARHTVPRHHPRGAGHRARRAADSPRGRRTGASRVP
jgi:hypothetical protein